MKLSMLALVTEAYGGRGGIAQYNRDFFEIIAKSSTITKIEILPRYAPDPARPLAPRVIQMTPRPSRVGYSLSAMGWALPRTVDLVFCGHLYLGPLAALIARIKRAKLVIQTHGIEVWGRPTRLRRAALESADLVLSVSRHTRAAVLAWADVAPERVVVVPDTVDPAFTPADASRLRTAWGLEGKRVLLTVGRMAARERYKGHDRVIAALAALPPDMRDVVYVVIGEGDDHARLEGLACAAGLADRVYFKGNVAREILIDAYRMADLFIMPSTGEGFGIAFLEAMACGTPALGLDVAGARDALADGEIGIAALESDLVTAMAQILDHPAACQPSQLYAAVQSRFGRTVFQQRLFNILRLIGPPNEALANQARAAA